MDEARVSRCAVEALTSFGHRRVGYPLDATVPWQVTRLELMREAAARAGSAFDIVAMPMDAVPPDAPRRAAVVRRLAKLSELPRHRLGEALARTEHTLPDLNWMFAGMADPRITALVAPSDEHGSRLFAWLASLRVRLPERFSLLSFDNYRSYRALPLSSVNFGFGRLGYFAFHSILRLIPTPRDQHGAILAQPFVAHRGSLGPACGD